LARSGARQVARTEPARYIGGGTRRPGRSADAPVRAGSGEQAGQAVRPWHARARAHARAYAEAKWPSLAPVSRRSVAEALVTVTIALTTKEAGAPEDKVLRQALFGWAFNPATRDTDPPPEIADALDWAERASLPVAELEDTATVRLALGACARNLTGKPAAGST
jgi:hypothetical protein